MEGISLELIDLDVVNPPINARTRPDAIPDVLSEPGYLPVDVDDADAFNMSAAAAAAAPATAIPVVNPSLLIAARGADPWGREMAFMQDPMLGFAQRVPSSLYKPPPKARRK